MSLNFKEWKCCKGMWKYFDWSSHWMLLVHWIGLIISNQPHSYGSEWPTGVIKCVQCDFFFTRTHSIIQIRRIVISGICYDFVVCSLVVWFILVKIQVLWIFFCTFWLLVMTLLFLWFISFFVLLLVSILALLFPPLQSTQVLWIM